MNGIVARSRDRSLLCVVVVVETPMPPCKMASALFPPLFLAPLSRTPRGLQHVSKRGAREARETMSKREGKNESKETSARERAGLSLTRGGAPSFLFFFQPQPRPPPPVKKKKKTPPNSQNQKKTGEEEEVGAPCPPTSHRPQAAPPRRRRGRGGAPPRRRPHGQVPPQAAQARAAQGLAPDGGGVRGLPRGPQAQARCYWCCWRGSGSHGSGRRGRRPLEGRRPPRLAHVGGHAGRNRRRVARDRVELRGARVLRHDHELRGQEPAGARVLGAAAQQGEERKGRVEEGFEKRES